MKVTDDHGASATDAVAITAGNTPPTATITSPTAGLTWKVGDPIDFAGSATDAQDGTLPRERAQLDARAAALPLELPRARASGARRARTSGPFAAPDHEYPSYLELTLTATDSGGLTDTPDDPPRPQDRGRSRSRRRPSGLTLGSERSQRSPRRSPSTVIQGSANTLAAPTPQTLAAGDLRLRLLVGRRRARAPDHRERGRHLHRDVHGAS